ncbi:envelope stress response membrane protein PspB [Reinekea blandensis]|uniref:Phage shock protein B n=1 Tax=Reinekea blandensis MED297 TaxID=314283 RepID=A4BJ89_9GAMM|nr:envelope stress response membrane protein PspB [Reinekea blandensis]EAR07842.1 phage shock protein B [Reinekea sp. MED297] [Reinekea blandensis MED297]
MQFFEFLFVPTILFMVVVMPIWLVMHYKHKSKTSRGLSDSDQATLDDLLRTLDSLADRMEALESILDERNPRWRRDATRE